MHKQTLKNVQHGRQVTSLLFLKRRHHGGVRALTIDTIVALPNVAFLPSKTVNQSHSSIQNIQVSGNSKFALEDESQSTMVRPQIWSGLSGETRHAQCIKPERVLSLNGSTKGTCL